MMQNNPHEEDSDDEQDADYCIGDGSDDGSGDSDSGSESDQEDGDEKTAAKSTRRTKRKQDSSDEDEDTGVKRPSIKSKKISAGPESGKQVTGESSASGNASNEEVKWWEQKDLEPESNPVVQQTEPAAPVAAEAAPVRTPVVRKPGLADRLSSLKKKKDSVLTKSVKDWQELKQEEGLTEELAEHTKSKDSFVERQAFLQRADLRQFEQEKSVRDKIRSRNFHP